jgi:predicted protein tyrosine phosphatase
MKEQDEPPEPRSPAPTRKRLLFVCSQNRLRSPTAEALCQGLPGIEATSAGTNNDAEQPLTGDLIKWADVIFAMERTHRNGVSAKFSRLLKGKWLVVLGIPDDYDYMPPELVRLLELRLARWLR